MIRDLSLSLRELLTKAAAGQPPLDTANVAFDRPGDNFNPAQPTLNVYLYDIRENTELRSSDTSFQRIGNRAAFDQRAPLRVAATYLVTAWSGSTGEQSVLLEQAMLSQALLILARNPRLPATCLQGQLVDQAPDLPVIAGQAEGLKNPSEFWTSLNNKLRPSITVTVTLSMPLADAITAPLVVSSEIVLKSDGALRDDRYRIGGRVIDAAGLAVRDAVVALPALGLSTVTDSDGRYVLGALGIGQYDLKVTSGNKSQATFRIKVPADLRMPAPQNPGDKSVYDMQLT